MNSGLFHPWIRVLRRSAVAYGDTLFSAIFLRYNFPRCSAQGGFANICSSDARVEIELYSHCFMQSLTYLTEHAQGRNSPHFSLASVGNAGLPQLFVRWITQDGGWAESYSSPKATRGNWYCSLGHLSTQGLNTGHHHQLRESHPWLQQEGGFALWRIRKHDEIPVCQERGSIHRTVFSLGHLSVPWIFTFWKKPFSCPAWRKLTARSCGVLGLFFLN